MIDFNFPKLVQRVKSALGLAGDGEVYRSRTDLGKSPYAAQISLDKRLRIVDLRDPHAEAFKGPKERVLIYRLGSLGDTVVALPCLHKLAQVYPDAERIVLSNNPVSTKAAPLEAILRGSGLVHGVIAYPVKMRSVSQVWRLRAQVRALNASTLIHLQPRNIWATVRDQIFFRLCGFRRIIGGSLSFNMRRGSVDKSTGLHEYECHRLARSIGELGPIDLDNLANWDLRLTDPEREAGGAMIAPFEGRPYIAINMGGKIADNLWGNENWRRLLADLAKTHAGYGILVVGVAEDAACGADVTSQWPNTVVNACGRLSPRESAAALENARLFIGHDSGPMHLAAARGVTCVAPFGWNNPPRKWHPYGQNHRIIHKMEGVAAITVDEMAAAVRERLLAPVTTQMKS